MLENKEERKHNSTGCVRNRSNVLGKQNGKIRKKKENSQLDKEKQ